MDDLDAFTSLNLPEYELDVHSDEGERSVYDPIRRKFVRLTPEEWVRQHFLRYLVTERGYPAGLTVVEMGFRYQTMLRRADIVVHDRRGTPLLMAECKAPDVRITQSTFDQVSRYNRVVGSRLLAATNGLQHYCWRIDRATGGYEFLDGVPAFSDISPSTST